MNVVPLIVISAHRATPTVNTGTCSRKMEHVDSNAPMVTPATARAPTSAYTVTPHALCALMRTSLNVPCVLRSSPGGSLVRLDASLTAHWAISRLTTSTFVLRARPHALTAKEIPSSARRATQTWSSSKTNVFHSV